MADEPMVLCVIRDMTNADIQSKITMNMPASMTVQDLIEDVARKFGYKEGSFNLTYERPEGQHLVEVCVVKIKPF